jgi:ribosomal RNA-processing protein 1
MSDKPLVQQALATELAEIVLAIPNTMSSLAFLRGFWESTVREWAGIDRLRYGFSLVSFTHERPRGDSSK